MAFDDLLYFREGAVSGSIKSTNFTTDSIRIYETPVRGLGINVVIPSIASTSTSPALKDCGLQINLYESDDNSQYTLIKVLPGTHSISRCYNEPGSFWDRFYTDKEYVKCDVVIVSVSTGSTTLNFGKVDIRLTSDFAKYAGT